MTENLRLPSVLFPEATWKRLMAYILACPHEVGGLGTIVAREDALVVEDVFLIEQDVTAATTRLDAAAVARFVARFSDEGRDPALLRFWWHSHAAMPVFWSGTDLETIRDLSEGGYLLSLVGNHAGETRVCLSVRSPLAIFADDLPFRILPAFDAALVAAVRDEVRAKVTQVADGIFRKRRRPLEPAAPAALPATASERYRRPKSGEDVLPAELRFSGEDES